MEENRVAQGKQEKHLAPPFFHFFEFELAWLPPPH